jgi:hypothetical protein
MSRDRSVSIVTGYGLDGWGSIPGRGKRFFSTPRASGLLWIPLSLLFNGCGGLFPQGVKRQVDHSLSSNTEVKNGGAIPPLSIRLHGVVLN